MHYTHDILIWIALTVVDSMVQYRHSIKTVNTFRLIYFLLHVNINISICVNFYHLHTYFLVKGLVTTLHALDHGVSACIYSWYNIR